MYVHMLNNYVWMSNVVVDLASNQGMAVSLSLLFPISVGQFSHPECNHFSDLSPPTHVHV
jgi:hypothetical protein